MAIRMRRGADVDFDPKKMVSGELAVTTDGTRKVYATFAPNDVAELAKKGDVAVGVEKLITVNGETGNQYTKMHIDVSESTKHMLLEKSDIADNLTTDDANKVLSAKQGKVLSENITKSINDRLIDFQVYRWDSRSNTKVVIHANNTSSTLHTGGLFVGELNGHAILAMLNGGSGCTMIANPKNITGTITNQNVANTYWTLNTDTWASGYFIPFYYHSDYTITYE